MTLGKRDLVTANAFVSDVASRLKNRVQISSDVLRAYVEAVEQALGAGVDFAQIVKTHEAPSGEGPERRYSPPDIVITEKRPVAEHPNMVKASTSYVERLNGTTRLHMRRLTRLTYAFSKRHNTLRCMPAMAAGIGQDFWTVKAPVEGA